MNNYREYCVVAIDRSKYGNTYKELFRGRRKDCNAFANTYCEETKHNSTTVHNEKSGITYIIEDIVMTKWHIIINCKWYNVCVKEVKGDNSIYNTIDVDKEDDWGQRLWGHRYWQEFFDKTKGFKTEKSEMTEIKLTREEKRKLKEWLYSELCTLSEYHYDLEPSKRDSFDKLVAKYFYWGDEYNDGYIPDEDYDKNDRLSMYLVQEFKKFLAIPVSIRY